MNRKLKGILLMSPIIILYTYIFIQNPQMLYVVVLFLGAALIFVAGLMGASMLIYSEKINKNITKDEVK